MPRPPRLHSARVFASPITGVHCTHIDSDLHFGRHSHDSYGFGVLEHGAQAWWSGRGHVRGYAGEVISTNPGEVHDGRPIGHSTRRWRIVYTDVEVMAGVLGRQGIDAEIASPVVVDARLSGALARLFRRIDRWNESPGGGDAAAALACEEALVDSCVQLMSRHGSKPLGTIVPSHDLAQVRERLADAAASAPSLAELAAIAGLSRYQVLRRFEKVYGLPPHAWLLGRRAERARVLIRRGHTLAAAAARCGFADQSHMNRVFVRHFGFTPGAWQRAFVLQ